MFKKPPNVKNLSVLRASDRKKVIQQIILSFNLKDLDSHTKSSLLPEGAQVCITLTFFSSISPDDARLFGVLADSSPL
jgi:hypothetical protein